MIIDAKTDKCTDSVPFAVKRKKQALDIQKLALYCLLPDKDSNLD